MGRAHAGCGARARRQYAAAARAFEIQRWTTQWALEVEWKSSYKDVCAFFPSDFPNSDLTEKEEESVFINRVFYYYSDFKKEELRSAAMKVYLCSTADLFQVHQIERRYWKYNSSYFWGRLELWKKREILCIYLLWKRKLIVSPILLHTDYGHPIEA